MLYKTIILEMLQRRPRMYEQLRLYRKVLPALEIYAKELKESHEAMMEQLRQARPDSEPRQIRSEAFEMALKEMEDRFPPASSTDDQEAQGLLDEAMEFIRNHSWRG